MITNTKEMLQKALTNHYAVAHFNINNLEWTRFILEECAFLNKPVILGVSESAIEYMGGYHVVVSLIKSLITDLNIKTAVAIHLDHGSVDACKRSIEAGFTSVMIDASKYDLKTNIELTKQIVLIAHENNVTVEAEIGYIGKSKEPVYVDIEDACKFVNETKIDSLAPAVGNVHGLYTGKPKIDVEKIKKLQNILNIPLVLHGGTGIGDEELKQIIESGITKVNINTELQIAWTKAIKEYLNQNPDIYDPRKIIKSGEKAIKEAVRHKLQILS